MKKIIFFISCFFCITANAQEYLIKHNVLTDAITYFKVINHKKDTVKIDQINLKKQAQITLMLQEYNPFYWGAKVAVFKTPVDESTGSSNVFNPLGLFSSVMQGFMPANFPALDMGDKVRGGGNSPEEKLLVVMQAYDENYKQMKLLSVQYNNLKNLEWELNQLKFDIKRTEAEIKASASESVNKLIPASQLTPEKILSTGSKLDNRTKDVADSFVMLKAKIQQLSGGVNINESITNDRSAGDMLLEMDKGKISVETFTQTAITKPSLFTDEVLSIGKLYNEISNTPFKYSYIVNGDPDITQLKLSMYSKADQESTDTVTKYYPIHNRSTIRLRNSIGLIFNYFGTDRSFFAKPDSTIGRGKGNAFSPALGTFINFYKSGSGGLKFGGALGFGLPLQGDVKEFEFLVGLSFILGRNEPIVLTIGTAGGKVNKLKNGWQVGDKVSPENFSNLTKSVYDLGGFFSVSMNLSSLGGRK